MKHKQTVSIAGASGVVGTQTLSQLLDRGNEEKIVAIGRRVLPIKHQNLVSKVADLQDVDALVEALPDHVDIAICTLGTTMKKAGSKKAFRAVDFDAVLNFAKASRKKGARHFLVVTAIGSNPQSLSFYSRTKGEVEQALVDVGFESLTILRPSIIDDEGSRPENRPGERIGLVLSRAIFSIAGKTRRYAPISAETIASALVRLAFDEATEQPVRIVESDGLHRLADAQ